jgi:hypothetical protein
MEVWDSKRKSQIFPRGSGSIFQKIQNIAKLAASFLAKYLAG